MSHRKNKVVFLGVILIVLAGAVLGGRVALARPPLQQPAAGATISYPGHLSNQAGQPVADGIYAFTFSLYPTLQGGEPLWSEVQEEVEVKAGAFVALLGSVNAIPSPVLSGDNLWLQVAVRGPAEADFTVLAPRQPLSAAAPRAAVPQAAAACAHDHFGDLWSGTLTSTAGLAIDTVNGSLLRGGAEIARANGGGLFGYSTIVGGGDGVEGTSDALGRSGVFGHSYDGYGVTGESTNSFGVRATNLTDSDTDDIGDLLLGGTVGELFTQGELLSLHSNGFVEIHLDDDNNFNPAALVIRDGTDIGLFAFFETGVKAAIVKTADYGYRTMAAVESPEVWFEDIGNATLVDGKADVTIEAIFAETINLNEYHVFLTPLTDEPVLLYVTSKTTRAFTVKGVTLDGRPASGSFDYRIAGKRLGLEDFRTMEFQDNPDK